MFETASLRAWASLTYRVCTHAWPRHTRLQLQASGGHARTNFMKFRLPKHSQNLLGSPFAKTFAASRLPVSCGQAARVRHGADVRQERRSVRSTASASQDASGSKQRVAECRSALVRNDEPERSERHREGSYAWKSLADGRGSEASLIWAFHVCSCSFTMRVLVFVHNACSVYILFCGRFVYARASRSCLK
jgi:hypothetical protein